MTLNLDLAGFPCSVKLTTVNLIQCWEIAQPASPEAAGRDGAVSSALRECLGGVGRRGRLGVRIGQTEPIERNTRGFHAEVLDP